jgi:hypothetical protein
VENRAKSKTLLRADLVFGSRFVRHIYRVELFPLVHLLGTGPDSGVFPDQNLGRSAAHPGRQPILHLYAGGQRGDAPCLPGHLRRHGPLRLRPTGRTRPENGGLENALFAKLGGSFFRSKETLATDDFSRCVPWVRRESAADALPYLAAVRLCRSAHRHGHAADRRDVQNGRLWISCAFCCRSFRRKCARCKRLSCVWPWHDRLFGRGRPGAARFETHGGLFLHQSRRLLSAGHFRRRPTHRRPRPGPPKKPPPSTASCCKCSATA